ncbi:MAG: hypothetical protein LCH52_05475 [Bacteroidetes bacterium]|nr:hypothetical protein [Bacteroidota bacterium]
MTESFILSVLSGAVVLITAMLAFFLKFMWDKAEKYSSVIEKVKNDQTEIQKDYLNRFATVNTDIDTLGRRFEERFDELKGVLENHFFSRHTEIVEKLTAISDDVQKMKNRVMQNEINRNNADREFRNEWLPVLNWAKSQMERNIHDS